MKVSKVFASLFALLGTALLVGGIVLCFVNRNAAPRLGNMPQEAGQCAEAFLAALAEGDGETAQSLLYGGAALDVKPNDGSDPVWTAYYDRFSYEFTGECYLSGTDFYREVTVTTLDVPSVTAGLSARAKALLKARVEAEEDPAVLYGDDEQFLPEVLDPVMEEAFAAALAEDAKTIQRTCRLQLYKDGGRWMVIPDGNLLLALSGGVN